VPGAAIAVVKDGRIVYEKGFGVASIETEAPVTPEMLFRIGSTTKMYTAVGLALLAEEGKVDLHAPIGDYIGDLDPDLARVTAHQLLVHMAGLKDEAPSFGRHDPEGMGAMVRGWTGSDYLFADPGEVFSYANPGYVVAGLLVEEVGDQPYAEQMAERIFEPLGMERTTFRPTEAMTWPLSQGHQPRPNGTHGVVRPYPDNAPYWPAGFMITNVGDLARFAIAFMNGGEINGEQVLSASALEMLPTAHADMGNEQYYGYGLFMYDLRGVQIVEHGGGIAGFSSIFKMAPDHQFAVIILTNLEGAFLDRAAEEAMALLLPLEPKDEDVDEEVTLSEEELARYTGTYRQVDEPGMVVLIEDGQLVVQAMGLELPLKPIGDDRFLIELPAMPEPLPVWFTTSADDEIEYFSAGSRAYRRE
jgi:CubicO group peptidase (beta-lactamase class C family)